jgi:hypothetical protein
MPPCVSQIAIQNRHPYGRLFRIDLGLPNICLKPAFDCLPVNVCEEGFDVFRPLSRLVIEQ